MNYQNNDEVILLCWPSTEKEYIDNPFITFIAKKINFNIGDVVTFNSGRKNSKTANYVIKEIMETKKSHNSKYPYTIKAFVKKNILKDENN